MEHQQTSRNHTKSEKMPSEGTTRQRLATYFLSAPPLREQTADQRREYLQRLAELGALEQQELLDNAGAARPMVWANPTAIIQAVCGAIQRLAAGLGITLMLFPAAGIALGSETALHPRMLTVTLCALLRDVCLSDNGSPVWVRLQEKRCGLSIAVTAAKTALQPNTLALIKECTRLHNGSLVHGNDTILFTCGQAEKPAAGVRLYAAPTEQELIEDSLSPVWSVFYSACSSSSASISSSSSVSRSPASTIPGAGATSSASS